MSYPVPISWGLPRLKRAGRAQSLVQSVPLPTMRSPQLRRVSFTNPFTTRSAGVCQRFLKVDSPVPPSGTHRQHRNDCLPATRSKNAGGRRPSHGLTSNGQVVLAGLGAVDQPEVLLAGTLDVPRKPLCFVGMILSQLGLRLLRCRRPFFSSRRPCGCCRRILRGRRGAVGLLCRLTLGGLGPTRGAPRLDAEYSGHDDRQPSGHHVAPMHRQPVKQRINPVRHEQQR